MGKATGFLEYERRESQAIDAKERIKNFIFHFQQKNSRDRDHVVWTAVFLSASRV